MGMPNGDMHTCASVRNPENAMEADVLGSKVLWFTCDCLRVRRRKRVVRCTYRNKGTKACQHPGAMMMQAFKTVRAAVAQTRGPPMLCGTDEPLPWVENSSARRLAALLPGFAFFCSLFC